MPGVQKPHCNAWYRRMLSCKSLKPDGGETPSMVVISAASACTASSKQPRTAMPVEQDRAGAADAVLAAEMRPGKTEFAAQRFGEVLTRLDVERNDAAIDLASDRVQRHVGRAPDAAAESARRASTGAIRSR